MAQIATRSNQGFTLVEVLISMLVLAVGMLGSIAGVMAAADYNLANLLRNEAIKIAQEQLDNARTGQYPLIADNNATVQRQIRKTLQTFTVIQSVTPGGPSNSLKQVRIIMRWTFKDRTRQYLTETIIRQRGV